MNERQRLMCELQRASFALVGTVLFLDSHPCDAGALEYYENARKKYEEATEKYEEHCGPVTVLGVGSEESWTWVETPWPWEMEAN